VLQYVAVLVAVRCSALQCACEVKRHVIRACYGMLQCLLQCLLQCVVCVLQRCRVGVMYRVTRFMCGVAQIICALLQRVAVGVLQRVAVGVLQLLQCAAVRCSVLQCVVQCHLMRA